MKIDNKKKVNARFKVLVLMLFTSLILGSALIFYLVILSGRNPVILAFSFAITLSIIYTLNHILSLKYFDYEHSGEVISIKHFHFWRNGIVRPTIELPKNHLESFEIKEKRNLYCLNLVIKNNKGKLLCFRCKNFDLTKEQGKLLQQSLMNVS